VPCVYAPGIGSGRPASRKGRAARMDWGMEWGAETGDAEWWAMGALLLLCRGAVAVQCSACLLWQQIACLPLPAAAILSDSRGFSAKPTRKLAHGRKREDLVVPPAETCRPPGSSSTSTSTQASAAAAAPLPASAAAAGVLLLLLFVALKALLCCSYYSPRR